MARRGNGRQRVVMQRMQKESARQVTFSKRRSGLMKKASELCTLCAAQVLIVVFSPGGKVFSFGHPSTESIIRKFVGEEPEPGNETQEIVQAHRSSKQSNLNFHLTQLDSLIDAEKRKGDAIDVTSRETEDKVWWEKPMEGFNLEQMELFMERVVNYKESLNERIRLLQQEGRELNGGVPLDGTRNGTHGGGSVFDPKGKGPASGLPSDNPKVLGLSGGMISFDPIVGGSSSQAPLDPMMAGLNGGVPYDPMIVGSSSRALLDPRIHGLNGGISFDPMAGGSSSQAPPRTYRPLNGGIQFDPMAGTGGSSSQTPGFYGGLPYEPMTAGGSEAVPFDQMAMGSIGGVPYNPSPLGFQARASFDPNAPGPSNGGFGADSFDAGASDYAFM